MERKQIGRRNFLKTLLAGAATVVGLRMVKKASASGPEGESLHQWAMVIDQAKCTGCGYCTLSCRAHNDVLTGVDRWDRGLTGRE